jgi:hypothetical protein
MAVDFHAHTKQKATNFLVAFCTMAEPVGFEPILNSRNRLAVSDFPPVSSVFGCSTIYSFRLNCGELWGFCGVETSCPS